EPVRRSPSAKPTAGYDADVVAQRRAAGGVRCELALDNHLRERAATIVSGDAEPSWGDPFEGELFPLDGEPECVCPQPASVRSYRVPAGQCCRYHGDRRIAAVAI